MSKLTCEQKDKLINLQNELIELMETYFECFNSDVDKYYKLINEIKELREEEELPDEILLC